MALFKFRNKGAADAVSPPPVAESIEAMRRRARHRLIGAVVLVLIGVIGFPLLFDTQPRPVAVDIPIEIPDRNKAKPLPVPDAPAVTEKAAEKPAPQAPAVSAAPPPAAPAAPAASARVAVKPPVEAAPKPAAAPQAKAEPKPEVKPAAPKPEARPPAESKPAEAKAAPADDGARARALLEGREPEADAPGARFVVQVGAYGDADKAREARQKLERAGLKTYVHVAETKDGKRTRVRVGPFATRAEADRAAEKIKGLDLPAAILTL